MIYSHSKINKCANVKIIFFHTMCHNSDMFRSILIIFSDLPNINKAYLKQNRWIIKFIKICAYNVGIYHTFLLQ
jgi:hypothetical protein